MRIDKYLSNLWLTSRKDAHKLFKENKIYLNDNICKKSDEKIKFWDKIKIEANEIIYKENIYIILHKPIDYVSSNVDESRYKSYKHLLIDCPYKDIIEVVWRLDADTTWLLLLTNNWKLIHKLIHPKKDVFKTYYIESLHDISKQDLEKLENWVEIDDFITKKAITNKIWEKKLELSISEWKFHQVKKMLLAINNEVIKLHRISIWDIKIGDLTEWNWRYLNDDEISYLENKIN